MNDYQDLNLGEFFDSALQDNTHDPSSGDSQNVSDHTGSQSDGSPSQSAPGAPATGVQPTGVQQTGVPPTGVQQPGPQDGQVQANNDHRDDDDDDDDGAPQQQQQPGLPNNQAPNALNGGNGNNAVPQQQQQPPQQNRNVEQDLDTIFNFGNRRNIPQGPQETDADRHGKRADKAIKAIGYIGDTFGLVSGAGKVAVKGTDELTKPEEPDPEKSKDYQKDLDKYNEDMEAYKAEKNSIETHNTAMNWGHIGVGLLKAGAGVTGMIRHGKKATAAKGRNRIVRHQSIASSVSAACKTVAGGMQVGTGAEGLKGEKDAANIFSIVGSSFGILGSTVDAVGSGAAAHRYGRIAELNQGKALKAKSDASHTKDNTIFKVNEMAGMGAKTKRRKNRFSAVMSGINAVGGLAGLAAPIVGLAGGSRVASGILGLVASGTSALTRAASGIAERKYGSDGKRDRDAYVARYLTDKINKAKTKASAGVVGQNGQQVVPGINLSDDQAKRVVLKQLGIYNGNIMNGANVDVDNDDVKKDIYNRIVMKRAQKLHDIGTGNRAGGNITDPNVQTALENLGLNKDDATVEEIAMAMGYQK